MPSWEHFAHGADIGIRGIGETPAAAFSQALVAIAALMTDPDRVSGAEMATIRCEARDLNDLFYDFVDAVVFEMSTRRMIFVRAEVSIEGARLEAQLFGEPVDRARHEPAVEVKGPTYTQLSVTRDPERARWVAQCVVDV